MLGSVNRRVKKGQIMDWQPIETYPKPEWGGGPMAVLARFYQHESEDGEMSEWNSHWKAIGCWFNGWKARSGAQLGVFPGNDWLTLKEPTHWAPLPDDLK